MSTRIRCHKGIPFGRIMVYLVLLLLVTFMALPLVYMISTAFKPTSELFLFPPRFFTKNPSLQNFSELFGAVDSTEVPFTRYIFNSLFVTVITVFMAVLVCSLACFAMTKMRLPFKDAIFYVITSALMFSPPVAQLINFITITDLGMLNTYWSLILPKVAGAMFFFLMKQNMEQIPDALVESAKVDGCGYLRIYARIILPLFRPAIATVVVLSFVASWNDFTSPMMYINEESLKTLPLALQTLQGGVGQVARSGAMAAATFLTTVPTIIVFLFAQSRMIKTMAFSGIK